MIKCCIEIHSDQFVQLFGTVFHSGFFPQCWNDGYISPIFKAGPTDDPNNYRGITINSCLGKFFTLVLNTRLTDFLENNNAIRPNQIGFRAAYRTADHIFVIKTIMDSYFKKGKKLYACFVDFRKAYDSVWRNGLFYKLMKLGISKTFLTVICKMYQNIRSCVKTSQGLTNYFESFIGVKQGCNLSPNLFNIFINDIPEIFDQECNPITLGNSKLNCLLYADDLLILSDDEKGLQNSINNLYSYSEKWKLNINTKKTKLMVFNKSGRKIEINCTFGKDKIPVVNAFTYLGTTLTSSGSFTPNQENLYNKGIKTVFSILKDFHPTHGTSIKLLLKLFDSLVRPILLYNCEVWGAYTKLNTSFTKFKENLFNISLICEKLHLKMMKMILGVNSKSTNSAVRAELGRFPLHISIYSSITFLFSFNST